MQRISITEQTTTSEEVKTKPTVSRPLLKVPPPLKQQRQATLLPWWGWAITIFFSLTTIVLIAGYIVFKEAKKTFQAFQVQAQETYYLAKETYDIFKTQDLPATKNKVLETQLSFAKTKLAYHQLESLTKLIGYHRYYLDGLEAIAAADEGLTLSLQGIAIIEPYADVLGFNAEQKTDEGTAEDRVKKILDTLEVVGPQLDDILAGLQSIQSHLNKIDASTYPPQVKNFAGAGMALSIMGREDLGEMLVQDKIRQVQTTVDLAINTFIEYRPLIDQLPTMMGGQGQRKKYLVLFQNNNELRPTGGFLTAYSIVFIENGKVTPEKSDDIYELDKKFTKNIPIPAELGKYLTTEKYWNLRDMNISPDFQISMEQFLTNYKLVKGEPQDIDGIIAIDTKVLVDLIETLGPINVDGYGEFTAEPDKKYDAPQIVVALSEIITRPTPYLREDRKGILGPMMKAVLERTYGAPKETFPTLFKIMLADIKGRHIQAYFLDPKLQEAAEKINLAGRMIAPQDGKDFLAIVDANLGGAKSNLFIDYDVEQTILPPAGDNTLTKKVVINYRNSRPGDNCNLEAGLLCLNATNNDWNRIYLPLGSQLLSSKGYKGEPSVYEENGFVVIDGFFALNPNSSAKIDLEYTIPYSRQDYVLQIWQQGGLRAVKHLLDVNGNQEEISVVGDIIYQATFE